jgi:hypothetical protein
VAGRKWVPRRTTALFSNRERCRALGRSGPGQAQDAARRADDGSRQGAEKGAASRLFEAVAAWWDSWVLRRRPLAIRGAEDDAVEWVTHIVLQIKRSRSCCRRGGDTLF